MGQLARRDIWIVDVEVFELTKKQVNCKETKGGIIIKNKKFLFEGQENVVVVHEIAEPVSQPQLQVNIQGQAEFPHEQNKPKKPIDWVVFAPEPGHMPEIKAKNMRFTNDKKYPIFAKKKSPTGLDEVLTTIDDLGREQHVYDKYFVPGNIMLIGDKELGFSETPKDRDGGNLYWGSANSGFDMPDIRRR